MNTSIYPCIWYDGNAEEAAAFYCKAFEDATMSTCTPLIVTFHIKGRQFMGMNGGPSVKPNPSISFFHICESAEEIQKAWNVLREEGQVMMPLDRYPWSQHYGWVQDKFGVSWQLMLTDELNKPDVFPSLMFVGEQNGKAQQAIDFYTSLFNNASIELLSKYEAGEGDTPGNIKHAQMMLDGMRLGVMESSIQHDFQFNWGVSLVISCDTQEEIDFFWLNLTEGGKESKCGWCQDAFGVWWQVVPSILGSLMTDPNKAPKVMEAFLKMTKFDIEAIKRAAA